MQKEKNTKQFLQSLEVLAKQFSRIRDGGGLEERYQIEKSGDLVILRPVKKNNSDKNNS